MPGSAVLSPRLLLSNKMSFTSPDRVLVPVDFSEESIQAVDSALEVVQSPENIWVIHVLGSISSVEPGVVWQVIDDGVRIQHTEEALQQRLADPRYQGLHRHVVVGDPGHCIAEFAAEENMDLIMLPSHGRTGFNRLLLGSVAERVVRLAHCPVLVIRR
ncbi:Universal stress protein [Lignipirellula cremea]|uniref:Universal stress protein n=2 Tax=Lignipirellula cremea TaxID=2528010 RepID=A0A518DLC3_9BACT|nr:Universal stress protein [Lignipirellula cremea]